MASGTGSPLGNEISTAVMYKFRNTSAVGRVTGETQLRLE